MARPSTRQPHQEDSFESRLPVYEAKKSQDFPAFLIVYCPRDDCPGTKADRPFLVAQKEWLSGHKLEIARTGQKITIIGRSCPYCFRTAKVPDRRNIS